MAGGSGGSAVSGVRTNFAAATRQAGPERAKPTNNYHKINRPVKPKFPHCPSRDDVDKPSLKRSCHLNMGREDLVQITEPDMDLVNRFLAEGEKFHGLWDCKPCGRWWMRYTRLTGWGKREHRWTHVYYAAEENDD